jgi:nicotinamidase-related amidase
MQALPSSAALISIDVQQGFDDPGWGRRNNPDAERHIAALLAAWRAGNRPVFHVQHHSTSPGGRFRPGTPGVAHKPAAAPMPGEPVISKTVNSAFIGTDLELQLRAAGIDTLVIVGLTADHCVSTTTRMAGNLGFTAWIVADATACFERIGPDGRRFSAELMHDAALASLHGEFATVVWTETLLGAVKTIPKETVEA